MQCTSTHLSSCGRKINENRRPIRFTSIYSPDLAPSDYYLFPNLKKWLAGQRFYSNEEVIADTNGYFADLDKPYYSEGINKLEHRWTMCISLKGDLTMSKNKKGLPQTHK